MLERTGVIDHAPMVQDAALALRPEQLGDLVHARDRPVHAANIGDQAGIVRDARHLDHGLCGVAEGDQEVRVDAEPLRVLRDAVGRRIAVEEPDAGRRLADRDDLEAKTCVSVVIFGDQTRLIAGGHGVNDAGRLGHFVQDRTDDHVGLDVEHHDMLARQDRPHRDTGADIRISGRLDNDVDREL